ncbi:TIM barrel protein [Methanobacterium alcaliphilum]|uniref:TIM barrel protein n=1 Tax=Methanobacterium alcaliphilum TaxID=392018 RepID=UPI002009EE3B|nr:TIM barrel protein [Methanobacterium alcaliphilum]MCK9150367.1 TIM barrel protein [Methanobacterium alcaliphilum]
MSHKIIFGPAGNPIEYKGKTTQVCSYISKEGLGAYEYQATYGVRIGEKSARELQKNSKDNKIRVSIHAPYYINLSSQDPDVINRSIERLIQSAQAAEWLDAYRIVFHPGFYTKYTPKEAMDVCKNAIRDILEKLGSLGIKKFTFAPETTGKKSQLGNLEEIVEICHSFDHFAPTIDFAHVHARGEGSIQNSDDYQKILDYLESELDIKRLHCHFTRIEYTKAGERKHHTLDEKEYGPPVEPLLETLINAGWNSTIICETPLIDQDALKLKSCYEKLLK